MIDYPNVKLSKSYLQLKIEAGSIYTGRIEAISENDIPMKMMVYDDAYLLRFKEHSLIGKNGEIVFLYEIASKHNAIMATERCNHRCIISKQ